MLACGHGKIGKKEEEIFQICLMKELAMAHASPSHCNAQEFYQAVNRARQNYVTELLRLQSEEALSDAQFVCGTAKGL